MVIRLNEPQKAAPLFRNWQETMIWSCLENVMGGIYTERLKNPLENPQSAMAILGDFCCFAGKPNRELVLYKPESCKDQNYIIMIPQNADWATLIEACYGSRAKAITRYAIKKEANVFNKEKLQAAVDALRPEYIIKMIDKDCFESCRANEWSRDLVAQFTDYEQYLELGIGAVILKGDELVSGASSYARYGGGIEIEIDTKEEYRRKGLAYACGAKLILECLKRDLYPSWDAHNKASVALAEKLGYHFDHEYAAYEIMGY